jgi:hypothetical protein
LDKVASRFNVWHGVATGVDVIASSSSSSDAAGAGGVASETHHLRLSAFDEHNQTIDGFNLTSVARQL